MNILFVEDDAKLIDYLLKELAARGCVTQHAATLTASTQVVADGAHDVYIIDRTLPDGDGFSWLVNRRNMGDTTPALFLTALGSISDKVEGLGIADDYIVKPFEFEELWARVQALLRRTKPPSEIITIGSLAINRLERTVKKNGEKILLMPMEYKLLDCLVTNAGQTVTRSMLLEAVWGFNFEPSTNIVQTYVSRLRAKIDGEDLPSMIETVRGEGYRMASESVSPSPRT